MICASKVTTKEFCFLAQEPRTIVKTIKELKNNLFIA
jgi:hypothetical protein